MPPFLKANTMKPADTQPVPTIHAASWLLSPGRPPLAGGAFLAVDGLVTEVGTLAELKRKHSLKIREYPGCAILPGFVNAHTHLELTHFPSWKIRNHVEYHPRRFVDWIIQLIKVKRGLTPEDYTHSINEGIRMCLESGTTAIGEIVTAHGLAPLYRSSALGGRLYFELLGHDPARFGKLLDEALAACREGEGRFVSGLSPHAPYTIGEKNLPLIRDAAAASMLPTSIHLAESTVETDFVFDSSGPLAEEFYPFVGWKEYLTPPRRCSSTELLERAGLLNGTTLVVHAVHVSRSDAEILKKRGVSVALCPRSNERLDTGKAPVALLKKLGIPLALGTDSLASNDSLSLWDEIRFALDTFSEELTPDDLFGMCTIGGAAAIGLDASHGRLAPGGRADFQVVSTTGAGQGLLERIIWSGTLVDVYLAGQRHVWAQPSHCI